jgi:toxin ParE1/3/4
MAAEPVYAREALRDLRRIWRYVERQSGAERADALVDRIAAGCRVRAGTPMSGRPRPDIAEGVRSFPVLSKIVLYEPLPANILVKRIIHASRELRRALRDYNGN